MFNIRGIIYLRENLKLEKWKKNQLSYLFMFSRALLQFIEKHQILSQHLRIQNTFIKYTQKDAYAYICTQTPNAILQSKQEIKVVVMSTCSPAFTVYVFLSLSVILIISLLVLFLLKCLESIRSVETNHGRKHYRNLQVWEEEKN